MDAQDVRGFDQIEGQRAPLIFAVQSAQIQRLAPLLILIEPPSSLRVMCCPLVQRRRPVAAVVAAVLAVS